MSEIASWLGELIFSRVRTLVRSLTLRLLAYRGCSGVGVALSREWCRPRAMFKVATTARSPPLLLLLPAEQAIVLLALGDVLSRSPQICGVPSNRPPNHA